MLQPVSARSFSTAELAGVLGISPQAVVKRARRKKWTAEARKIQGGGCLWQCASLDEEAKHKVTVAVISGHRAQEIPNPAVTEARTVYVESLWDSFNEKPNSVKDRAAYRYELLFEAWMLHQSGTTLTRALVLVAEKHGESVGNLRNWYFGTKGKQGVRGVDPKDWLPLLADNYKGRVKRADCHPKAWDFLLKDYLRQEQPSFSMCYERVARVAAQQGWVIPSERTLRRRLKQEHGPAEIRFARTGSLRYAYPDQERRRDAFLAGEAVSGDALRFDKLTVFDEETGEVFSPVVWFFEDIYSGKLLAWDADTSENSDMFRRAVHKLTNITLPRYMCIDNTPAAANKCLTGQVKGRHRFTNKSADPVGLLPLMGIDVHFTNPDQTQSSPGAKPQERAFGIGGIHERMRNWPAFKGRGTSLANPIPYAEFLAALPQIVAEHNAKTGRRGGVCNGRSFDEVFAAGFSEVTARKPSEKHRSLLLHHQEVCTVSRDGTVRLNAGKGDGKHRYYGEVLARCIGEKVAVLFNPDNLSSAVSIFTLTGKYLGTAEWMPSVAFNDTKTAREHAKNKARRNKAVRLATKAAQRMSDLEYKQLNVTATPGAIPNPACTITTLAPSELRDMLAKPVDPETAKRLHENLHRNISALHDGENYPFAAHA